MPGAAPNRLYCSKGSKEAARRAGKTRPVRHKAPATSRRTHARADAPAPATSARPAPAEPLVRRADSIAELTEILEHHGAISVTLAGGWTLKRTD